MGRYPEAVSELKQAVALAPDSKEANSSLKAAYDHLGDSDLK